MDWETIKYGNLKKISSIPDESRKVIVISSYFEPKEKLQKAAPLNYKLAEDVIRLLAECTRVLKFGGLLFIYGLPHQLAYWGEHISFLPDEKMRMLFKYWIALDIDDVPSNETLKPTHLGLL